MCSEKIDLKKYFFLQGKILSNTKSLNYLHGIKQKKSPLSVSQGPDLNTNVDPGLISLNSYRSLSS